MLTIIDNIKGGTDKLPKKRHNQHRLERWRKRQHKRKKKRKKKIKKKRKRKTREKRLKGKLMCLFQNKWFYVYLYFRMHTLAYTLSTSSHGGVEDMLEDVDLDEVIPIPKFDLETLTLE